jgi:magnesium transporter
MNTLIQIKNFLNEKKFIELKDLLNSLSVVELIDLVDELQNSEALIVFRLLTKERAAELFSYLPSGTKVSLFQDLSLDELQTMINELYFDDLIDLIETLPANMVKTIIKYITNQDRVLINKFLYYPINSAGSIMTIEMVELKSSMDVAQAIEHVKVNAVDSETIYTCYVIDESRVLKGSVSLRKLLISDSDKNIEEIMDRSIKTIHTHDDQEFVASLFKKYDLMVLPVVDHEDRLIGIITVDDVIDVIDQENTEDFEKMAAIFPSQERYLDSSIFRLAKNRIAWLIFLMISATITGSIIRQYEDVLQSVVVLAVFIPMLMDTGGNSGAQSATLVIRGMAVGEIKSKDLMKVIWKETRVSTLVGIIMAMINFLRMMIFDTVSIEVALVVSITLFITIVMAKIIGAILPIGAHKLKLDPAIMASPLITTIVDAAALVVYFYLAILILGIG